MTFNERNLYHQIQPVKLFVDIVTGSVDKIGMILF